MSKFVTKFVNAHPHASLTLLFRCNMRTMSKTAHDGRATQPADLVYRTIPKQQINLEIVIPL